jgi:hypothetical protein
VLRQLISVPAAHGEHGGASHVVHGRQEDRKHAHEVQVVRGVDADVNEAGGQNGSKRRLRHARLGVRAAPRRQVVEVPRPPAAEVRSEVASNLPSMKQMHGRAANAAKQRVVVS